MKLQAEQATRRWDDVLDTAAALAKLGGIGPAEAAAVTRGAHLGNLHRKAQDAAALAAYWKQIPADMRTDAAVAAAAARHHLALGANAAAQAIIEQALEREWSAGLVALYGEAATDDALPQIERAEKWLRSNARGNGGAPAAETGRQSRYRGHRRPWRGRRSARRRPGGLPESTRYPIAHPHRARR